MKCLRSLERWDRGFESLSKACLSVCAFIPCLCCPVCKVAALRRADHSSKESYRLCKKDYETEKEARAQQRAVKPLMNELSIYAHKYQINAMYCRFCAFDT
jgi:hypothetical protein